MRPRAAPAARGIELPLPLLAALPPRPSSKIKRRRSVLETREKSSLWSRLEADARRIAEAFGLEYRTIEPEREGVRRHYGITYSDGTIRIRLRHAKTRRPLKYSSLVNTVCHELAHLKHFNHGKRFKRFYFRLLDWARSEGIYRPSTTEPLPPVQLGLFAGRAMAGPLSCSSTNGGASQEQAHGASRNPGERAFSENRSRSEIRAPNGAHAQPRESRARRSENRSRSEFQRPSEGQSHTDVLVHEDRPIEAAGRETAP